MQFKYPYLLYSLGLLLIPLLIHLFQLRRFKIEYFSTINFLKELVVTTRKSSQLKKYLLLATRMLFLTFLVISFAQPFYQAKDSASKNNSLYLVLDNSFSMQAKGEYGELLKKAIQDLLEKTPEQLNLSILTNDIEYWNTNTATCGIELQKLKYSPTPFSIDQALTRIAPQNNNSGKDIVFITDGCDLKSKKINKLPENCKTHFLLLSPQKTTNISIDSVYITQSDDYFHTLQAKVSSNYKIEKTIPVSLFNENTLVAKTILKPNLDKQIVTFTLPKTAFNGYITFEDASLNFDNTFYFSIPKPKIINVLSIGNLDKSDFLSRIYTQPDFNFINKTSSSLDYRQLENQDCIILNELETIPYTLHSNLKKFIDKGGNLVFIPSEKGTLQNMNHFLAAIGPLQFMQITPVEKKITRINFSNPLFNDVFEKQTNNFQYPYVKQSFVTNHTALQALTYNDQQGFLNTFYNSNGAFFLFTAPLNLNNSNFQNSPLIVPVFYKMGTTNNKNGVQYQTIGQNNPIVITHQMNNKEALSIYNAKERFIPLQQIMQNKIKINCINNPTQAGNFIIAQKNKKIDNISFNYNRNEKIAKENTINQPDYIHTIDDLEHFYQTIQIQRTDKQIWKWFLIFALLFFIIEIVIQKIVK